VWDAWRKARNFALCTSPEKEEFKMKTYKNPPSPFLWKGQNAILAELSWDQRAELSHSDASV